MPNNKFRFHPAGAVIVNQLEKQTGDRFSERPPVKGTEVPNDRKLRHRNLTAFRRGR
jgi:hypothetical protein